VAGPLLLNNEGETRLGLPKIGTYAGFVGRADARCFSRQGKASVFGSKARTLFQLQCHRVSPGGGVTKRSDGAGFWRAISCLAALTTWFLAPCPSRLSFPSRGPASSEGLGRRGRCSKSPKLRHARRRQRVLEISSKEGHQLVHSFECRPWSFTCRISARAARVSIVRVSRMVLAGKTVPILRPRLAM
jgi:hypothetical protein